MSSSIPNRSPLGKLGEFVFTRQSAIRKAPTHPSLLGRFNSWRAKVAARDELDNLSDRELADIGLTRIQIAAAVRTGNRG